jgi:competence protein ComEA
MSKNSQKLKKWLIIFVALILSALIWQITRRDNSAVEVITSSDKISAETTKSQVENEVEKNGEAATIVGHNDDFKEGDTECEGESDKSNEYEPVYLVGAVAKPGIYHIDNDTCLYQLVEMAGGFLEEAADDKINLAGQIDPYQLIRIPTEDEWQNNPVPSSYFTPVEQNNEMDILHKKVNINTADAAELETLQGVGPATAKLIIDYREEHGLFTKTTDIMKVPGIKQNRYDLIEDSIVVVKLD